MLSFGMLCLLLGVGYAVRQRVGILQRLCLPASIVAGVIGLALLQALPLPAEVGQTWRTLPGLLINIVFACLFLGLKIPSVGAAWKSASRQLAYGQFIAWGQYAVGCILVLLLLKPVFGQPDLFAGIMAIGFEGGHGTAAGMGPVFDALGFSEMKDFALASATGGITGAILVGMALVNWAVRRGHVRKRILPAGNAGDDFRGIIPVADRPSAGKIAVKSDVIGSVSLQIVFVGSAVLIGWLIDHYSYTPVFVIVSLMHIVSACMVMLLIPRIAPLPALHTAAAR